jgi:hypothetical protein
MANVSENDLKNEIGDMSERFPQLQDSDLFVAWFLKCLVTENEDEAIRSLVGGARDKNLDAIHIDEQSKMVCFVQGKYRQRTMGIAERRSDVTAFAHLAQEFSDADAFASYVTDLDPSVLSRAEAAHKCVRSRGFRMQFYFVTTGRCSAALAQEAQRLVRQAAKTASIEVIDGKRVLRLLSDYLDGVAPPVPLLELEIESGQGIKLDGVLQRFDSGTKIESWVFPVNVRHIAEMYEQSGIRLFARNVRGFLGETSINKNMERTLEKEPENFWYYNNGITIVCDSAEKLSRGGRNIIRLVNPQVINGQQTTRTLHKQNAGGNSKATVLVRVISVPRENEEDSSRFENLVSKIVAATNWQNSIRASDLMANDRKQIEIERNLRKLDYQYVRKRQSKSEARRHAGMRHKFFLKKEELAQAVAACDLDPSVVREGKEQLFEERHYAQIFPNADPYYYLPRHWLVFDVSRKARGYPSRAYAKWLVAHFLWQRLQKLLTTRQLKRVFVEKDFPSLLPVCNAAFKGAIAFYYTRRGRGETAIDVSSFFKRRGLHLDFERFWKRSNGRYRAIFRRAFDRFETELHKAAAAE